MDKLKQAICDWLGITRHIRSIQVKIVDPKPIIIPEGATIIISVSRENDDIALVQIRKEVKEFFEGYKVVVFRECDVGLHIIAPDNPPVVNNYNYSPAYSAESAAKIKAAQEEYAIMRALAYDTPDRTMEGHK